jgi:hypothetical protein
MSEDIHTIFAPRQSLQGGFTPLMDGCAATFVDTRIDGVKPGVSRAAACSFTPASTMVSPRSAIVNVSGGLLWEKRSRIALSVSRGRLLEWERLHVCSPRYGSMSRTSRASKLAVFALVRKMTCRCVWGTPGLCNSPEGPTRKKRKSILLYSKKKKKARIDRYELYHIRR